MSAEVCDPRERFAELARLPDAKIDLAFAALWIAAEEYPSLDVHAYLGRLDALAAAAAPRLGEAAPEAERAESLLRFLYQEQGFTGNEKAYDDPRNSYLNEVLDRRTGIPITLALVLLEVARRLELPLRGVSFPGHFLVKLEGPPLRVLDPFFGRVLEVSECRARLHAVLGPDARLDPERHLRAATPREILVRMLTNLKQLHLRARDFGRTLACCERILLLAPDSPTELRDRGLVFEKLECFAAAAQDLERFLKQAPDDETAPAIRDRLRALRARPQRLH
jgi:regulator of sirC expression with transglutaminase-like and TPR domain